MRKLPELLNLSDSHTAENESHSPKTSTEPAKTAGLVDDFPPAEPGLTCEVDEDRCAVRSASRMPQTGGFPSAAQRSILWL